MSRKTWKLVSLLVVVLTMAIMVVPAFAAQEEVSPSSEMVIMPRGNGDRCRYLGDVFVTNVTHQGSCIYEVRHTSYYYNNANQKVYSQHPCVLVHPLCGLGRQIVCNYFPYP